MKSSFLNLLPAAISERSVLNHRLPKISLGLLKKFQWLFIINLFILLSGYYPAFSIPPIQKSYVYANSQELKEEIVADSFPQPIVLPHTGYLSTKFSNSHPAIDIAAGLGMPIHPITEGAVEETGTDFFGLGKFVVISHQKGFKSKYAHMGKIYVKEGDEVNSENILGEVGLTGKTSGPHTHLEVSFNGKYIDPQTLLPNIPKMPMIVKK